MLNLKSENVKSCVSLLANNIRAENIEYKSYIDLYSGTDNIQNIHNLNNTVIYGRRGSGKTHLLRALQEKMIIELGETRSFPVYIDIRRIVPLLSSEHSSHEVNSILIFKYLMQELALSLTSNIGQILNLNEFDHQYSQILKIKELNLLENFQKIYLEFDGRKFNKPTTLTVSEEEIKSLSGTGKLSKSPEVSLSTDVKK